jgi:hypothetical protein
LRSRLEAPGTVNETFLHTPRISAWVTHKIETCNHIFLPQLEVEFMCDSSIWYSGHHAKDRDITEVDDTTPGQ